jgi:protein-tyrosine phosphatase
MKGVAEAISVLEAGGKVYIHCHGGRRRSVALAASVLIAQGYDSNEAMDLLKQRRSVADPYRRHIRQVILKFEQEWLTKKALEKQTKDADAQEINNQQEEKPDE